MKPFSPLQSLLNKDSDAETQLSYDFSLSQHFSHLCAAFLLLHFLPALLSFSKSIGHGSIQVSKRQL